MSFVTKKSSELVDGDSLPGVFEVLASPVPCEDGMVKIKVQDFWNGEKKYITRPANKLIRVIPLPDHVPTINVNALSRMD